MGIDEVVAEAPSIIYVDHEAGGANDGSSWDDAFTDPQDGLTAAQPGIEIWVAAGTYYPGTSRWDSFAMLDQVAIYGGFDPSTGDVDWQDRDWVNNVTTVSGDIGAPGDSSDNSHHVFYHPDGASLDASAILDGLAVTAGNADGSGDQAQGGGMYNYGASPTVANCTFLDNQAAEGGGLGNYGGSSPAVSDSVFDGNSASTFGGGLINHDLSAPTLTACLFTARSAPPNDLPRPPRPPYIIFRAILVQVFSPMMGHPPASKALFTGRRSVARGFIPARSTPATSSHIIVRAILVQVFSPMMGHPPASPSPVHGAPLRSAGIHPRAIHTSQRPATPAASTSVIFRAILVQVFSPMRGHPPASPSPVHGAPLRSAGMNPRAIHHAP